MIGGRSSSFDIFGVSGFSEILVRIVGFFFGKWYISICVYIRIFLYIFLGVLGVG